MLDLSLLDALALVLDSVARVSAATFRGACARLQLREVQIDDGAIDPPGFPRYDASHTFVFRTDNAAPAALDLLEYRDSIIQVRLSVQYRPFLGFLFSKRTAHMRLLLPMLTARYGHGLPGPGLSRQASARGYRLEILNFSDDKTDAYLSLVSGGPAQSLYVNVGDRAVWLRAGGRR